VLANDIPGTTFGRIIREWNSTNYISRSIQPIALRLGRALVFFTEIGDHLSSAFQWSEQRTDLYYQVVILNRSTYFTKGSDLLGTLSAPVHIISFFEARSVLIARVLPNYYVHLFRTECLVIYVRRIEWVPQVNEVLPIVRSFWRVSLICHLICPVRDPKADQGGCNQHSREILKPHYGTKSRQ